MNRNEEYRALLEELSVTPAALDNCVERARRKARKRFGWRTSLASLGGAAAAFVMAVNLSVPFAMACSQIPGLRELTAAVAFSSSLKAAVQNDHVQLIDHSQTVNGIDLNVDYLIFDASQIHFFYSLGGGDYTEFYLEPHITDLNGKKLQGYSLSTCSAKAGELSDFSILFENGFSIPEGMRFTCDVRGYRTTDTAVAVPVHSDQTVEEPGIIATFTFEITFDPKFTAPGETIDIDQWVSVDGQRFHFRTLEINPTHARLTVEFGENNTAWCNSMQFYLTDREGNVYESGSRASTGSSLVASGSGEDGKVVYFLESPYFTGNAPYTVHITGASWRDKDHAYAEVDLKKQTAEGFPEGYKFLDVRHDEEGLRLSYVKPAGTSNTLVSRYLDPEGNEYDVHSFGYYTRTFEENGEEYKVEEIFLEDYQYDTVTLKLNYTRATEFEPPVEVTVE